MDLKEAANIFLFWVVAFLIVFSVIYISSQTPIVSASNGLGLSWIIFWLMLVLGIVSFALLVYSAYISFADRKTVDKMVKYLFFQVSLVSLLLLWVLFITAYFLRF